MVDVNSTYLSASVVGLGKGVKLLLACCVPQHQAHLDTQIKYGLVGTHIYIYFHIYVCRQIFLNFGLFIKFEEKLGKSLPHSWICVLRYHSIQFIISVFERLTSSLWTLNCFSKKSTPMVFLQLFVKVPRQYRCGKKKSIHFLCSLNE